MYLLHCVYIIVYGRYLISVNRLFCLCVSGIMTGRQNVRNWMFQFSDEKVASSY
jgi:hypothetical protein